MKRVLGFLFVVVFVCLGIIAIVPSFIDLNTYKNQAVREVEALTGLELNLNGNLDFSLLPFPRFIATDVSVASPPDSKSENLISFVRLDVNVALMPLFHGQVYVDSITLVKPMIALEILESGRLNALTDKMKELLEGAKKGGREGETVIPAISLNEIRIKDGFFSYFDHKSGQNISVQNINADLSAESLIGPFRAQGSMFYDGYALSFDIDSNEYNFESKIISPKVILSLQPSNLTLEYAGVMSFDSEFSVQGQTSLRIENVSKLLSRYGLKNFENIDVPIKSEGMLTADAKKLDYKNFEVQFGDEKMTGSVDIDFSPFKYSATLRSHTDLDLQKLMGRNIPFKKGSLDLIVAGDRAKTSIRKSTIKLGEHIFNFSGGYSSNKKTDRPVIDFKVTSPKINYDEIFIGIKTPLPNKRTVNEIIASLALPIDFVLDLSVDKVIWRKKEIKGVGLSAKFLPNSFSLSRLAFKDLAESTVKVTGGITNLQNASGINLYVDLDSADVRKLAQWFEFDSRAWPKVLKKAQVKAKFSGAADAVDVTANMSAMNGEVIAHGRIEKPLESFALNDLALQIKHKNMIEALQIFTGVKLSEKKLRGPLDFYTKVSKSGQRYTLEEIKGDLSGISAQGILDINLGRNITEIKGDLVFGEIKLDSVMAHKGSVAHARPHSRKTSSSSAVRWSKEPIDTSFFHLINSDISLRAKKIEYGAWPLINPSLKLVLKNGVLDISDLKAGLFGGDISLSTKVQTVAKSRQPIHFDSNMDVKNADLGGLARALIGTQLVKMSGKGNLEMDLNSSGSSPAALVYDLSGEGLVTGSDIVLDGVDVKRFARALSDESRPGDTVLGLWKSSVKGGNSSFDTLDGVFYIKDGVVQISKMDVDGVDASIETRGNIHLPNWTLATKHKIFVKGSDVTPSDVPPFEISFSGSLDSPAQTFGQGLLDDYINRKIQRKFNKLLSDKLGLPSNDNQNPQSSDISAPPSEAASQDSPNGAQQAPQKGPDIEDVAEEAIKGILEGLLR